MKCGQARELYTAYRAGELGEELQAAVAAHLRECPACAAEFAALDAVVAAVRDLPPATPPPGLRQKVREAVVQTRQDGVMPVEFAAASRPSHVNLYTQQDDVMPVEFAAKAKRKRTFSLSALAAAAVFCIVAAATLTLAVRHGGAPERMFAQRPSVAVEAPALGPAPGTPKAAGAAKTPRRLVTESNKRPTTAPSGAKLPRRTTLPAKHTETKAEPKPLAIPSSGEAVVAAVPKQPGGASREKILATERGEPVAPALPAVPGSAPAAAPPPPPQGALEGETAGAAAVEKAWPSPSVPHGEKRMAVGGATAGPKGPAAPPTDRAEEPAYAELAVEAPKYRGTAKRITVAFSGEPLAAAIRKIGELGDLKITVSADVNGRKVYRKFVNVPADKALREVAAAAGCKVSVAGGTYVVSPSAVPTGTPP